MARLPNEVIEQIKTEVSLLRLVESQGYHPKKQGKDYALRCPFHDDKTPSLIISANKNLFNCFGCGESGSVIDWVMKTQGVNFRHAVEVLQQNNPALKLESGSVKRTSKRKLDLLPQDLSDEAMLSYVIDYYHHTLLQTPDALAYLEKRGLGDPQLIDQFKLGFANRTLGYRLPDKQFKAGKLLRGQLQQIGLLRETGHEHFNGSIVVPVLDSDGNVVEVYGRKTVSNLRRGTPKHLYLPGPHAGVWNAGALVACEEVILCEALIDAMTFWCAGFKNVTASYGTGGFTDDHLILFKQQKIQRVLIAYDRDEAGNNAAEKLAKKLNAEGLNCYRLHFPKDMDANRYALEVQPASKSLGVVIRAAQPMGETSIPQQQPNEVKEPETPSSLAAAPLVAEPLPASAVPPSPTDIITPEVNEHDVTVRYGERCYRVRGLEKNRSYDVLKVNVLLSCGEVVHVDTFDLYSAKHRHAFAKVAAVECGVEVKTVQRDLGQLLLQLEQLQDQAIQDALKPKEPTDYKLSESEKETALNLLCDPQLTERIINDFKTTGLVGEPTNALMGYLAVVSRKLKTPLAIIVQSTSAAGKSALMDAVLKLVPEEDRVHYSAMTGQSLFYLGETNLKHKILGIAEEEGVRQAAYALKLLQSQGELTIASTGKDPQSGKLVTEEYRVEGPVMLFLTTTAIDIDEELLNRCVVLTINESREQTAAIQQRQRQARTLNGLLASHQSDQLIAQHKNAQRLLKPLAVVNPYAEQLRFADSRTRTRRDHEKYLTLIDSTALLHQYQRKIKTVERDGQAIEYIEATLDDIALANHLAHDILGRSLDELPPPTRQLLKHLHTLVNEKVKSESLRQYEVRFTRKEIREVSGLSNSQVGVHLTRLVELEYVLAHHGRNGRRFVYELVFDGDVNDKQAQLIGLIDVEKLKKQTLATATTDNLPALNNNLTPSFRPASGDLPASLRSPENMVLPNVDKVFTTTDSDLKESALIRPKKNTASYRSHNTESAEV